MTAINTAWAGVEEPIFEDDDPALIYGSLVVAFDAGGAGAAPEGEIARITDYDSGTQTLTHDAVSTSLAVNDRIGIASPLFPFNDMRELANIALRKLGKIEFVNTALSLSSGVTEYTLPIKIKPKRVRVQGNQSSNNNEWRLVQGWGFIPATAGSFPTLVVPGLETGNSLELLYEDLHPELKTFDSDILEAIDPELALCALLAEAYQWYNNKIGGSSDYFKQRENKAIQDLEAAKVKFPFVKSPEQIQGLVHWNRRSEYVPGTSDLRY